MSHIGNCRFMNQDNFICSQKYMDSDTCDISMSLKGTVSNKEASLFGVFDGMGGEEKGEVAAFLAAKTASEISIGKHPKCDLSAYCRKANAVICQYSKEHEISSMGTTAALLLFTKADIYLCNIGDSKIFCFASNNLEQISQDHIMPSAFGVKPPLSQNLGIPEAEMLIEPYIARGMYNNNDMYLICSDGLTDMLNVNEIEQILKTTTFDQVIDTLLKQALVRGGKDNITILLCKIERVRGWKVAKAKEK